MIILTTSRLFTFVREGTMYEISTACFIYRSIFAVQALRKRRVQGHRMMIKMPEIVTKSENCGRDVL